MTPAVNTSSPEKGLNLLQTNKGPMRFLALQVVRLEIGLRLVS